jgi:hypothetical protein
MARTVAEEQVERRTLSTMWLVFCPDKGLITTEPYLDNAYSRAYELGSKCFVIEAAAIYHVSCDGTRRVYKIERDRLHIEQEML